MKLRFNVRYRIIIIRLNEALGIGGGLYCSSQSITQQINIIKLKTELKKKFGFTLNVVDYTLNELLLIRVNILNVKCQGRAHFALLRYRLWDCLNIIRLTVFSLLFTLFFHTSFFLHFYSIYSNPAGIKLAVDIILSAKSDVFVLFICLNQ